MGSAGICRLRERNLGFIRFSRPRCNIWTSLPAVIAHLSIPVINRYPPSLSDGPLTHSVALALRFLSIGQGTGRNADALALAPRERFAVIIDAKVRSAGYVLGTEDRKFLEYARSHGAELQRQGYENLYFVVVGSAFKEGDLRKLTDALSSSPIRSANLLTASALMRLVEDSIRDRSKFSLGDFERQLFAHKIIAT